MDLAKTHPPATSPVLRRERLFSLLDRAVGQKMILVQAQKGQGKSILAADYLECRGLDYCWYNLDPSDANMAALLEGLSHSLLRGRNIGVFPPGPSLVRSLRGDGFSLARVWIEANLDAQDDELWIVLDDCHRARPAADALVRALMRHSRPNIRVIALTRSPLDLDGLGRGEDLVTLGNDDLTFTWEETRELFRVGFECPVDETLLREVWQRSEGWVVGLVLFRQYLGDGGRGRGDKRLRAFLKDRESPLFQFFAGSVLESFSPSERAFLETASLFENIYLPLPGEITGSVDAGELLERMKENNLFTFSRGPGGGAYYFHSLFRSFLRSRFAARAGEAQRRETALLAATFLGSRKKFWEAVDVLVRNRLYAEAADTVDRNGRRLVYTAGPDIVARLCEVLPREMLAGRPWLRFLVSQAGRPADPQGAAAGIREAFESFAARNDGAGMSLCLANLAELTLLSDAECFPLDRVMSLADGLIGRADLENYPYRSLLLYTVGMHDFRLGRNLRRGSRALLLAAAIDEENRDVTHAVVCLLFAAILLLYQGELEKARQVGEKARSLSGRDPAGKLTAVICRVVDVGLHLCAGRFREGWRDGLAVREEMVDRGIALPEPVMSGWDFWLGFLGGDDDDRGRIRLPEEDAASGKDLLRGGIRLTYQGLLGLFRGEPPDRMADILGESLPMLEKGGAGFYLWVAMFARGVALARSGRVDEAIVILDRASRLCREGPAEQLRVSIRLYLSLLHLRAGRSARGMRMMRESLTGAGEAGYGFFYCLPPDDEAEICATAITRGVVTGPAWEMLASLPSTWSWGTLTGLAVSGDKRVRREVLEHLPSFEAPDVRRKLDLLARLEGDSDGDTASRAAQAAESVLSIGPPLSFAVLGPFGLTAWGRRIGHEQWRSRNVLHLLQLLCVRFPRGVSREQAAEALWPEGDPASTLLSLRVALSKLRHLLEEEAGTGARAAICATREHIVLDHRLCRVDLADYRELYLQAMSRRNGGDRQGFLAAAARAVDLFGEDTGPGEGEPEWLTEARGDALRQHLELLWNVSLAEEEEGRTDRAVEALERMIRLDDLREDACRRLMKLLADSGKRAEAVRVYQACRQALHEELGVEPEAATRELFETIRQE